MTTLARELETFGADEKLERRRHRHWYDRLMMLSDGVFAIAITLLAAEVAAPAGWGGGWPSLWPRMAAQLDAYAVSFLVISIYWLAHRRFMAMILTVDAPVTILNLVVLGLIALLPAATRLISLHGAHPVARTVYACLVILIGAALGALWGYAALVAKIASSEVPPALRWFFLVLIVLTPPFFLLITLAVPNPVKGEIPLLLAALFLIGWPMRLWVARRIGGNG
ncbi:MAG: TMEM175 family protein [Caulobacteraceae bacterium]